MGDFALVWDCFNADMVVEDDDVLSDEGMRTAVILSLFTDARAEDTDELPGNDEDRRGFWADELLDDLGENEGDRLGSRLWLLDRASLTPDVVPLAQQYAEEALQWMIDDGVARSVAVLIELGSLKMTVTITRPDGEELSFRFAHVWDAEFAEAEVLPPSAIPRSLNAWNTAPELAGIEAPSHLWGDFEQNPEERSFLIGGTLGNGLERTNAAGLGGYDTVHNACTFEAWIKPTSFPANQGIWSRWFFPGQLQFFFNVDSTGRLSLLYTTNGSTVIPVATPLSIIQANVWQHVAFTFDATDIRFYLNGVLQGAPIATGSAMFNPATADAMIAADDNLSVAFTHKIYLPRAWNAVRSAAQILANYNRVTPDDTTNMITALPVDGTDTSDENNDFTLLGTTAQDTELAIGADIPDGIGLAELDQQDNNVTRGATWNGLANGLAIEASQVDSTVKSTFTTTDPSTNLFGQWIRIYNPAQASGMNYLWSKRQTQGLSLAVDHDNNRFEFVAVPLVGSPATLQITPTGAFYNQAWDILVSRIDATTVAIYAKRVGDSQIFEATATVGAGDDYGATAIGFEYLAGDTGNTVIGAQVRGGCFWNNPSAPKNAGTLLAVGKLR